MNEDSNVTIIIPVFNEEEHIGEFLSEIKKVVDERMEILVIDDGSTDNTNEILKKSGVKFIRHPYNKGNGSAIKTGIRNANTEFILMIDGDGQHNPSDIPRILEYLPEYDMVVGARTKDSENSKHRNIANKVFNSFGSYVTGFNIEDLTSGFRAIKRNIAKKFLYILPNGFSYPTTLTLAIIKAGYSLKYVPIKTFQRKGKSKISPLKDGIKFLIIIIKIATLFSPFKVFFPVSIISFVAGLIYGSYMIIVNHHFSNMVLLLLITGLLVFLMGLIAEQISMLRMERSEDNG